MNPADWKPTKFEPSNGEWRVTRDRRELMPSSRFSANLVLRAFQEAFRNYARGHLADFGCGKVPFYGLYRDLVDEVTCIDWPGSLHESAHIDIFADLNQHTTIADDAFDTIISSSVLEHIWRHDVFWDEMVRTIRPGGHIILNVPFIYALHEEPHDYFRWTKHALARACEERHLTIVHLAPYGGGPDVLADLFIRSIGAVSMISAGWLATAATYVLSRASVRRLGRGYREKLPLGYMLVARKTARSV